jgi:hypothetical protein
VHTADWWLGELDDPYFKALESAVTEEWDMEPLRIREGGVSFAPYSFEPISPLYTDERSFFFGIFVVYSLGTMVGEGV